MKTSLSLLAMASAMVMSAPASAATVMKHFNFSAVFGPETGSPVDVVSGTVKVTFDNAANILGSTENFSLTGLNIPLSAAPDFSYNASSNNLIIGTSTTPWAYGSIRTRDTFGFFYNVATDSILTLGFTNSTGNFYLSRNVTVAAVPEPASWAMMIAGFGVVGGAMRRRQRTAFRFA